MAKYPRQPQLRRRSRAKSTPLATPFLEVRNGMLKPTPPAVDLFSSFLFAQSKKKDDDADCQWVYYSQSFNDCYTNCIDDTAVENFGEDVQGDQHATWWGSIWSEGGMDEFGELSYDTIGKLAHAIDMARNPADFATGAQKAHCSTYCFGKAKKDYNCG